MWSEAALAYNSVMNAFVLLSVEVKTLASRTETVKSCWTAVNNHTGQQYQRLCQRFKSSLTSGGDSFTDTPWLVMLAVTITSWISSSSLDWLGAEVCHYSIIWV